MTDQVSVAGAVAEVAAESSFAGVVRVDRAGRTEYAEAFGLADRAYGVPMTLDTQLATASVTKTFTGVTVLSLAADGALALDTPARSLLGDDLPEIDDGVSVEHLLAHRSGIGDYVDEEIQPDVSDYVLELPVHRFVTTEEFLPVLSGRPQVSVPGETFAYNNSGYVVLALLAERAGGRPFHDLVAERVFEPAGMTQSAFLRSDELPATAARHYLAAEGLRSNVLHLPVMGTGDGGAYVTVGDLHRFWAALLDSRLLPQPLVAEMFRPRSSRPSESRRYGLACWRYDTGDAVFLEGYDAGVSARSLHDPSRDLTWTVLSSWSDGAWPVARALAHSLA
jgi:CubicO group peptidase (beta-lactamase class C family)